MTHLGGSGQILAVTHLPQVAVFGSHHYMVAKAVSEGRTRTEISAVSGDKRTEEIARMLGGVEITQKTIDHAAEMLSGSRRKQA